MVMIAVSIRWRALDKRGTMLEFPLIPDFEDITIVGVDASDFTPPRNAGERGWARHDVPVKLSHEPPPGWDSAFERAWTGGRMPSPPPSVEIRGRTIVFTGTTWDEVRDKTWLAYLKTAVERANGCYREQLAREAQRKQEHEDRAAAERQEAKTVAEEINRQIGL